jgi:hypothetical protein
MTNTKFRALTLGMLMLLLPILTVALLSALPTEVAQGCNPCDCPEDNRVNCQGIDEYAVFTRTIGNGENERCYIDVYLIDQDRFRRAFRATSAEIAEVPELPEMNTMIDSYYEIALYRLTSGEFQVNYGPSRQDGKIYELIWTGCPFDTVRENSYVPAAPEAAAEETSAPESSE